MKKAVDRRDVVWVAPKSNQLDRISCGGGVFMFWMFRGSVAGIPQLSFLSSLPSSFGLLPFFFTPDLCVSTLEPPSIVVMMDGCPGTGSFHRSGMLNAIYRWHFPPRVHLCQKKHPGARLLMHKIRCAQPPSPSTTCLQARQTLHRLMPRTGFQDGDQQLQSASSGWKMVGKRGLARAR